MRGGRETKLLLFGLVAALGCDNRPLDLRSAGRAHADAGVDAGAQANADAGARQVWTFLEAFNRDVDILFVIDDSVGMSALQRKMLANFPVYMQVLDGLPGGRPDLHLAVISTDMGAGPFDLPQCSPRGDRGAFQSKPRGACAVSGLDPGQTFVSDVRGRRNYTGAIQDVFTCIAALGEGGCGFEHPLASVVRALGADGAPPPPENAGFLRPNAYLFIFVLTNEDDCSAPPDSGLFDPRSRLVSDPLGPLTSFRCNEFGHLCDGVPPPRTHAASFESACVPAEGAGKLTPVADLVRQVKRLKADPSRVLVAITAGLPTPYRVEMTAPGIASDPSQWPSIAHSCVANAAEYADPGVRLAAFVDGFGSNGLYLTICAPSFAPALQQIAETVGTIPGPNCLDRPVRLVGGQPDCVVTERRYDENGTLVDETALPACAAAGGVPPCWQIVDGDIMGCTGARKLTVSRAPGPLPSAGTTLTASCAI